MDYLLTESNCKFQCPYLEGNISIISKQAEITDLQSPVLTKASNLLCTGSCAILTAQAQGVLQPCMNNLSDWIAGIEKNILMNGNAALNIKARKKCNAPTVPAAFITANYIGNGHYISNKCNHK